jgi:predicted lipid-binding transport protein (Tim44 family)
MNKGSNNPFRMTIILVATLFLLFVAMESVSFARAGGGRSSGSRGFSSGSSTTRSAPSSPSQPSRQPGVAPASPGPQPSAAPSFGRSLLYGIGGGMLGGMLGSMLFGGHGFAGGGGGWGSGGFGMSDMIIILVILGIVYFVVKRFRARRQEMEMSSTGPGYGTGYAPYSSAEPVRDAVYDAAPLEDTVSAGLRHIREMDPTFDENRFKETVEDIFFKIQSAWTKRDLSNVKALPTPQMLNTFQENISRDIADKRINRLENIAVRQVDIVDAVQDQGEEYVTVKFVASLLDYTVDEATNQVVAGSDKDPVKFLEYWTFNRKVGERNWALAGITQEGDY